MKHHVGLVVIAAVGGFLFAADGCAVNPWFPQDIDYSQSSGGAGGIGGMGGAGGSVMPCVCSDDGNPCTDDVVGQECPGGDANVCHMVVAQRQCTQTNESPGVCDNAGACVGQPCQTDDVCKDGNCVDGYCCNSTCDGPCNACDRVAGTCSQLPYGMLGQCITGELCGNNGICINQSKAALGALCTNDPDCQTKLCRAQICRSSIGQPCVDHLECASNLCDPAKHTCASCESGVKCPDGASCLTGGRCQVFAGQPSQNSDDCVPPAIVKDGLMCTLPIGKACTDDFQCVYRRCVGGACADQCSSDGDCPMGYTCTVNSACRLPPGSYCVIDDQCQGPVNAGKCAGFPRRCQ